MHKRIQRSSGRAHDALVDARNTAAIVIDMARAGFRFRRTRGLNAAGDVFGREAPPPKPRPKRTLDDFFASKADAAPPAARRRAAVQPDGHFLRQPASDPAEVLADSRADERAEQI